MHAQKILHRDVKTANVLRMSGEIVKLGDLGVAKLMKNNMTNTQIGTPHYMPPEVWRTQAVHVQQRRVGAGVRPLRDVHVHGAVRGSEHGGAAGTR